AVGCGSYQGYVDVRIDYSSQRRARADQIQERFGGAALSATAFGRWAQVCDRACSSCWAAFDDAAPALSVLRSAGLGVGCVTNAAAAQQRAKLAATGLAEAVPLLVTLDTFGVGKPDPRVFQEAVRRLDVPAGRVLYVGDEPVIDARAASAAGLRGVWLDRPGRRRGHAGEDPEALRAEGIAVVQDLQGVLDLLHLPPPVANAPLRGA